jgi:adenylylsulfate kinase
MEEIKGKNIFTIFDEVLQKSDKEKLLKQKGITIWMTGLSGSGKTTIAKALERKLHTESFLTQILDGDNVRAGINNNLTFSETDRIENIRRIAEVSKLFVECGVITINCFVSPTIMIREMAKRIIGENNFYEVFINTPISVCEGRDVKGLYKKARNGEIKDFTGINAPFEAPLNPAINILTEGKTIEESTLELYKYILPKIQY